jgi:hypothetical protein
MNYIGCQLCLRCRPAKYKWYFGLLNILYSAVYSFKFFDVFNHCFHKTLGMEGGKYYSAFYFAFGCSGHYVYKVDNKLGVAMCNNGQVGIFAFGYLLGYFNIQLVGLFRLICHKNDLIDMLQK